MMHSAQHPFIHPFAPPAKRESDFIEIVGGDGAVVRDSAGNEYIDGLGSLWYCQIGHGRPEMRDAIVAQMDAIESYSTFDPFTNSTAARLAEMIVEISPHPDGRVFFGTSGSEAIDTALKLARLTAHLRGEPDRQYVVTRTHGYHGTNFGGTAAQGIAPNREGWGDRDPHFLEVPNDDIESMASVFAEYGDRIAAVLAEPVQGAGGVHMPPEGYLAGARRLCDQHGALLVFDEVISGFGRTGEWFGAQTFDVVPDMMTFAKGVTSGYLPLSGVILARSVCDTVESMDGLLRTGYTYSGHPTCAAAAIRNIEIIRDERLVERARHLGDVLGAGLGAMVRDGLIVEARGVGGLWAADLGEDSAAVRTELLRRGVILRNLGTVLAMCPPLVITDEQLGSVLDHLAEVVAQRRASVRES
jgi:adenosylmethionine-8-amino-7-oxononanoate aminotransferase